MALFKAVMTELKGLTEYDWKVVNYDRRMFVRFSTHKIGAAIDVDLFGPSILSS